MYLLRMKSKMPAQRRPAATAAANRKSADRKGNSGKGVVQRAIAIGTEHFPRDLSAIGLENVFSTDEIATIQQMNTERDKIYIFQSNEHFKTYIKSGGMPPLVQQWTAPELQQGHKNANMERFSNLYQPATHQIPDHAPGAHNIPEQQLPPAGPGHLWAQTQSGADREYTLWQHQHQPPPHPTEFNTFGNPDNPSIFTSQGNHNMGGRVQPAPSKYLVSVPRSRTTYGHLDSETGFVRGHPMSLNQQQRSTEPGSKSTFDNTWKVYTRESDGTKGGLSTYRYNQLERPAEKSGRPFNQVNASPDPQGITGMGIAPVSTVHFSIHQGGNNYVQQEFDNTVDYRTQIGRGNKFHTRLAAHVQTPSYPYESVHRPGALTTDPQASTYSNFLDAPPTPFMTEDMLDRTPQVHLRGRILQGQKVRYNGDQWVVEEAEYNETADTTACTLTKPFTTTHQGF